MRTFCLVCASRVCMFTFGGNQSWTAKKDTKMHFDNIIEQNSSYTIGQAGLNFYVLETQHIMEEK